MIFDLERLPYRESYRLLVNTVVPRPIALVTTLDREGRQNAAPFSFFNVMGHDPPTVVLGIERQAKDRLKDTARNIRERHEFVVNLVSEDIAERMNICAVPFPADVDELQRARLTPTDSTKLKVPRIAESPVSLECREMMSIGLGSGRSLVVGTVVALHLADQFYDEETWLRGHGPLPAAIGVLAGSPRCQPDSSRGRSGPDDRLAGGTPV